MPKFINALTDLKIRSAKPKEKDYSLRDGEGLYVLVKKNGRKIFRLDYVYMKKRNTYTIGDYPQVSLSQARRIKYELKELIAQGIDPNRYKQEQRRKAELQANKKLLSFVIDAFLEHKKQEVSPERYTKNYLNTFNNYITPFIGHLKADEVSKYDLIKIIKNSLTTKLKNDNRSEGKTYKAREIHRLLKNIFAFALHNDYIQINPADTIDIDSIVPKHKPKKMKAITDEGIKEVYAVILRIENPLLRLPLQFIALTALRVGNISNLKWEYIDFNKRLIIYPAQTMKNKQEPFRLPLTSTLIDILTQMQKFSLGDFVFCSLNNAHKPIHSNALLTALKTQGITEHTPHGFRSSFETIAMERQKEHGYSFEAIEAQLHHNIGTKVTRSYLRTDFLEERYKLLEWWEDYLTNL